VLYLDTSVLLTYTLTQAVEPRRFKATAALMPRISAGEIQAATSFHALHEVLLFGLVNAPDSPTGAAYGKAALECILALPVRLLPLVSRLERGLHSRRFQAMRDPADVPHAIAAWVSHCETIVTYDKHFQAIAHVIPCATPEALLDEAAL
jgi:predicted nucleic acid-binding protein